MRASLFIVDMAPLSNDCESELPLSEAGCVERAELWWLLLLRKVSKLPSFPSCNFPLPSELEGDGARENAFLTPMGLDNRDTPAACRRAGLYRPHTAMPTANSSHLPTIFRRCLLCRRVHLRKTSCCRQDEVRPTKAAAARIAHALRRACSHQHFMHRASLREARRR